MTYSLRQRSLTRKRKLIEDSEASRIRSYEKLQTIRKVHAGHEDREGHQVYEIGGVSEGAIHWWNL